MTTFNEVQLEGKMRARMYEIFRRKGFESQISKLREEFFEMCLELQRIGGYDNLKGDYDKMIEEIGDFLVVKNQFASEFLRHNELELYEETLKTMRRTMKVLDIKKVYKCVVNNKNSKKEVEISMVAKICRTLDGMESDI